MCCSIYSGQIYCTLQVVQSCCPTVAVKVAGKVGFYVYDRLQCGFVFVCTNIDSAVYQSSIVCKVLFVVECRNVYCICIVVIAALIEQCHARTYAVVATVNIRVVRVDEVRTLFYVRIICSCSDILIIIAVGQVLCAVVPRNGVVHSVSGACNICAVISKRGVYNGDFIVCVCKACSSVRKECVGYKYRSVVAVFYLKAVAFVTTERQLLYRDFTTGTVCMNTCAAVRIFVYECKSIDVYRFVGCSCNIH